MDAIPSRRVMASMAAFAQSPEAPAKVQDMLHHAEAAHTLDRALTEASFQVAKAHMALGAPDQALPSLRAAIDDDRAGTTGERYGDLDAIAWYDQRSSGQSHPVGEKEPNAWGLFDTLGNVWEWCWDRYASSYPNGAVTDPTGPTSGSTRVNRGGSWFTSMVFSRAAGRESCYPDHRYDYLGFRLARSRQ